jgi:8-oxo-dGTP pyrophosphatase MutT (NUDIX family)
LSHNIQRLQEIVAYENEFVTIYDDKVKFPSGRHGRYLRIEAVATGTPVVLLAHKYGHVGLVRTYRYPIRESQWALPRGFAHGGSAEESAADELREELGVTRAQLRVLGHVTPDSGLLSTRAAVVLAHVDAMAEIHEDHEEVEAQLWVTPDRLSSMIRSGEIEDGFTLSAWMLSRVHEISFSAP